LEEIEEFGLFWTGTNMVKVKVFVVC